MFQSCALQNFGNQTVSGSVKRGIDDFQIIGNRGNRTRIDRLLLDGDKIFFVDLTADDIDLSAPALQNDNPSCGSR